MKLLDLFETRQTWVFNFTVAVYSLALGASGSLVEKLILPAFQNPPGSAQGNNQSLEALSVEVLAVIFSIVLPLLVLPLYYLFVDVSIYTAALNAGHLDFERQFNESRSMMTDPGIRAYEWLEKVEKVEKEKKLKFDLHSVAKRRANLFLLAPAFGVAAAVIEVGLVWFGYGGRAWHVWIAVGLGLLISGFALLRTIRAYRTNHRARMASYEEIHRTTPPRQSPGSST